jgi:NH3-dependent NAD+ synthetase
VEPVLPISLVLGISGGAISAIITLGRKFETVDQKQQTHVAIIEKRMDSIELRLAQEYVDKTDLQNILERLDARIDRMDYKLDQILIGYNKTAPPQI